MTQEDSPVVPFRSVHEWTFRTARTYANPYTGVTVNATFTAPSGQTSVIDAFHDGDATWQVRFNPGETGTWHWRLKSTPPNPDFDLSGSFEVSHRDTPGFLRSTPGEGWGFATESGEPVLVFGDTTYHLFGMAHNSDEGFEAVTRFMTRRRDQGFNLLRIRIPTSPFHPPDGHNRWQTRDLWPWGGSSQKPQFDRFNLDYFRTVDAIVAHAESLGIGIEMIMQAWGFEFPFNARDVFVAEWEELWIRYLVARYDAFGAIWFWQLQNEYEYYPDGDWRYDANGVADRWAIRIAHLVRRIAPHGHPIAIHNGPRMPSFGTRFAQDLQAIDTVMYQSWGTTGEQEGWLAAGIDEDISAALGDWPGSGVLAEWGYEFNPDLPPAMLSHQYCDVDHTRRGAWRGAMCGLGIIHGFENSWGPFQVLDEDQPGLEQLQHLHRFFTETVPFHRLRPEPDIATGSDDGPGRKPLTLATPERDLVVTYLPIGGSVTLTEIDNGHRTEWFDPRTGSFASASPSAPGEFVAPDPADTEHPDDWVLVMRRAGELSS